VSLKSNPGVAIRVWWLPAINKLPLDASHPLIKAVPRANSWMERLLSGQVVSQEGLTAWHPKLDLQNGTSAERFEALSSRRTLQKVSSMAYRHLT
jgi:hypothetical protein